MSWLYIHFPDVIEQDWIGDEDAPFAVVDPATDTVIHVSPAAEHAGVEVDMSVGMASYLCADLQLCPFQPERYQATLLQRALWAYQFSSQVCMDQSSPQPSRQGLWLNMDGMLRLFHGVQGYCQAIKQACQQQQWQVSIAAAHTPLAARHLALNPVPWHCSDVSNETSMATFAEQRLRQLAISEFDLDETVQTTLRQLGIKTLDQLLRLPMSEIHHRICPQLALTIKRLLGQVVHPLDSVEMPDHYQHSTHFISEIESREGLLFPLKRLLGGLCGYLQHRQFTTQQLRLTLSHRNIADSEWVIQIAYPEHRLSEWTDICRYQLERHTLPAPVQTLTLSVEQLLPLDSQQLNCFDGIFDEADIDHSINTQPDTQQKEALINRLQARMDAQQLQRLTTTGDPRPEYAQQSLFAEQAPADQPQKIKRLCSQRPLWLISQPQPCSVPTDILSGPERIDGGWWDQQSVRRDYYIVRSQGRVQWMFRTDTGDWFVHGYFS